MSLGTQIERPISVGDTLPTTVKVGKFFFLIGTPNKLYVCKTANAWVEIASVDASGNLTVSGNEHVTGNSQIDGTLNVTGVAETGGYKSSDGTAGASATVLASGLTSLTFKNGLFVSSV